MKLLLSLILFFITNFAFGASFYQDSLIFGADGSTSDKIFTFGNTGDTGCFRFEYATKNLQYSDDCLTYKDFFESPLTTRGDILVINAAGDHVRLATGTASQVLTSDGTDTFWASLPVGYSDPLTTEGDVLYRTAVSTDRLPIGTASQVLTSNGTTILWDDLPAGYSDPLTTDGDLLVRTLGTTTRLPIGTASQVLTSDGTDVIWENAYYDPLTTRGDLLYKDATNTSTRLAVGAASQVLTTDGTDVSWSDLPADPKTFDSSEFAIYTGSNDLKFNVTTDATLTTTTSGTIALTADLLPTAISTPAYKDVLAYNNSTSKWDNRNLLNNYTLNDDFEVDATGWTSDANITIARNTTTPLIGTADGVITKDAADRSTEKIYTTFSIDSVYKSRNVEFSFEYATSANYVDDDIEVKIYDVTNAAYVSSNPQQLKASDGNKFYGVFQAASNSTSYRLDFVIASTNASAYTINIDDVTARPFSGIRAIDGSGKRYDLTVTGTDWTTDKAVGYVYLTKELVWRLTFNIHGERTPRVTNIEVNIVGIVAAHSQSVDLGLAGNGRVGNARIDGNTNIIDAEYTVGGSTSGWLFSGDIELASKPDFVSEADFPQLLDLSTNEIMLNASLSSNLSLTPAGTFTEIKFDAVRDQIGSGYNAATGRFTAPESAFYEYGYNVNFDWSSSVPSVIKVGVYKNGTGHFYSVSETDQLTSNNNMSFSNSGFIWLNKGDYISVWGVSNTNVANLKGVVDSDNTCFYVAKRPRNNAAIISEKVIEVWSDDSGQSVGNTYQTVTWNTKEISTHNAMDGITGIFTAPKDGYYDVNAQTYITASLSSSQYISILIAVDEVQVALCTARGKTGGQSYFLSTSKTFSLKRGQTIKILKESDVNDNLGNSTAQTFVSIRSIN